MKRTFFIGLTALMMAAGCGTSNAVDESAMLAANRGDGAGSVNGAMSLNDVTLLLPLPTMSLRQHSLWLVPREGEVGPYFPIEHADQLPDLNADLFDLWPAAVVTALRFDPCSRHSLDSDCTPELRLAAQAVFLNDDDTISMTDDAAAHLFYTLDDTEAADIVDRLVGIRDASPVSTDGPLRVHPGFAEATLNSPLGEALRSLVLRHAREDNFRRIALNTFAFDNWGFAEFEFASDGSLVRTVPRGLATPDTSQTWIRQAHGGDLDDPSGVISPPPAEDDFSYLLSGINFVDGAPVDAAAALDAAAITARIDNPDLVVNEQHDCVGCHLAGQARIFAGRRGIDVTSLPELFSDPDYDLTPLLSTTERGNLSLTIQLGYHLEDLNGEQRIVPVVGTRVVNESAWVAARLSGSR